MTPGAAVLVALLLETANGTAAETGPTKVRLELRAPRDCTSRADLTARIAARSARIEVVDDATISAHVDVGMSRPGNVVADLVLTSPGSEQAPRRVVARSCAEVADGVALIIAVTLDPNLRRTSAADSTEQRQAPPADAPTPAAVSAETRAPTPVPAMKPEAPASRPDQRGRKHELEVSAAAQTIFGPAPSVMPGIGFYFLAGLDRDGLWAPALVVGATHVWRSDLAESGGSASFTLDAASLDVCPLRLRWSRLTARPCASALLGRLAAQGSNTTQAANAARPFGAAGAVVSASVGAPIELTARLGIGVTLLRDSYEFASDVFYRAAAVTISASVGVGFHWP